MRYEPVPAHIFTPCQQAGALTRFAYTSTMADGTPIPKVATVYLPHDYDPTCRYPVLYLMHGGGGDETEWFREFDGVAGLKNLLDHAFFSGHAAPMLVVTPTYLIPGDPAVHRAPDVAVNLTHRFPKELVEDLIPAIDAAYPTIADREHRAFGGFSMGAETTWSVLADAATHVKTVLPLSGDYWAICLKGGKDEPVRTVDALLARMAAAGVSPTDCRILAATGDGDIAYPAEDAMVREMATRPEFTLADTPDKGNLCYLCKAGGVHCYQHGWEYVWQLLPWLF